MLDDMMGPDEVMGDYEAPEEKEAPVLENVMTSKDLTRSRKIGEGGTGVIAYNYTGVDPKTGKDRKEAVLYNREPGAKGVDKTLTM